MKKPERKNEKNKSESKSNEKKKDDKKKIGDPKKKKEIKLSKKGEPPYDNVNNQV